MGLKIFIAVCAVACVILLVIIWKKLSEIMSHPQNSNTSEMKKQLEMMQQNLDHQNQMLMDQSARQSELSVRQISVVGNHLRETQAQQQARMQEILAAMQEDMYRLRQENQKSLMQLHAIVTEKFQTLLDQKMNQAFETMVHNMTALGKRLEEGQSRQQTGMEERLQNLEHAFGEIRKDILSALEKIRDTNEAGMQHLRQENQESLDRINAAVNEKLQKTLDDKIAKSFATVNARLMEVYQGLGEMKAVASGVSDLKKVLSNVKTRGILGEIQLSAILAEILAPEQYGEQIPVKPGGSERVDFAVKLPGSKEGTSVYLPIDSKFPGDTYAGLLAAYDSGNPEQLKEKRNLLEAEIKRCAKSIQSKYIVPPHTTDFAIMFLPFEGLYAEVVNMGLVETLQKNYKVNIAGPSTMAAMLNSLQMGFRTLAIQKKSGEVWKVLEAAKKEFGTFETVLLSTRNRLRQADEELEKLIGTRTRAINRKLQTVSTLDADMDSAEILELEEARKN